MAEKKIAALNIVRMNVKYLLSCKAPYNDDIREIKEQSFAGLRHSINRHGYLENIIFNKQTEHIVSGHRRLDALDVEGFEEADVHVIDVSLDEEKVISFQMNNRKIQGDFTAGLQSVLDEIEAYDPESFDISMMFELRGSVSDMLVETNEIVSEQQAEQEDQVEDKHPEMELRPYESYDAILVLCTNEHDFNFLVDRFGLERVNSSPVGKHRIGLNRCVSSRKVIQSIVGERDEKA